MISEENNLHKALVQQLVVRSCLNCENFDEKQETCSLTQGKKPPATIVVFGCIQWTQHIPF